VESHFWQKGVTSETISHLCQQPKTFFPLEKTETQNFVIFFPKHSTRESKTWNPPTSYFW